jgi:hypothetical protein
MRTLHYTIVDTLKTKPITVRFRKELSDKMDEIIAKTAIYNNKPELILGAIRNNYINFMGDFETVIKDDMFCRNMAGGLFFLEGRKGVYNSYKGEMCQTIVRIPFELYERLIEVLSLIDLSMQDFIKGSIISEMRMLESYSHVYRYWEKSPNRQNPDELKQKIRELSLQIPKEGLIKVLTGENLVIPDWLIKDNDDIEKPPK